MILSCKMVLSSVVLLLILKSLGKSMVNLFVVLLSMMVLVSLEMGMSGSGLLGLIFFLVYVSGMLVLFLYMFCLFSKTFKFLAIGWNWSGLLGLIFLGLIFFYSYKKKLILEDSGGELGMFLDSESLFVGVFFISFFLMALWLMHKMLCLKKGCIRPFY